MYDLSILIPSRNEMFVSNTVRDILKNKRGKTEVIVGLDGAWTDPGIPDHPDVRIVYVSESRGQRGMTNTLARLSKAKYLAKSDAHCAFDKGFDVKLMEAMKGHDDWTVVPIMRNLHAFDWKCMQCGKRTYQGPTPGTKGAKFSVCEDCGANNFKRKVIWYPKPSPQSTAYCFDPTPHFQYMNSYKKRQGPNAGLITGYSLTFSKTSLSPSVIGFLANFARSHKFTGSSDPLWVRQNMPPNTVSFTSVDNSGGVTTSEISSVGNELQMARVTTPSVSADMVNNGDMLSSTSRDGRNQPSESDSMCESFLAEMSTPTITSSIDPSCPIPTAGSVINSDVIDELNRIIGGEFVYSEKTSSFHNNSVTLTLIRDKGITPTMSLQGSFFLLTREKYWELNICDEAFGSWGSQGIEVACKTWLSGGQVMCIQTTWYSHMFRTQGGDFSFPYEQRQSKVIEAKQHAKNLFSKDKHGNFRWDKQIYPVSWLVEQFMPVDHWTQEDLDKLKADEAK